jgi:hypothetical protein
VAEILEDDPLHGEYQKGIIFNGQHAQDNREKEAGTVVYAETPGSD